MKIKIFVTLLCLLNTLKYQNLINIKNFKKAPFIIYGDLEFLIERIDRCKNNPENSSTTKVGELISPGFLVSTMSSFKALENDHDVYRRKDSMKIFCISLREHTIEIINIKQEKMKLLTKEQQESYENPKICYIHSENFQDNHAKNKYCQVRDHFHYTEKYRGARHSMCNLKYTTLKEFQ